MPRRLALEARPFDLKSAMTAELEVQDLRDRAAALREMAREPVPSRVAAQLMEVAAILDKRAAELEREREGGKPSQREPRLSDVLGGSVTKQMMGADRVQRQHVERVMRKVKRRHRSRH